MNKINRSKFNMYMNQLNDDPCDKHCAQTLTCEKGFCQLIGMPMNGEDDLIGLPKQIMR